MTRVLGLGYLFCDIFVHVCDCFFIFTYTLCLFQYWWGWGFLLFIYFTNAIIMIRIIIIIIFIRSRCITITNWTRISLFLLWTDWFRLTFCLTTQFWLQLWHFLFFSYVGVVLLGSIFYPISFSCLQPEPVVGFRILSLTLHNHLIHFLFKLLNQIFCLSLHPLTHNLFSWILILNLNTHSLYILNWVPKIQEGT